MKTSLKPIVVFGVLFAASILVEHIFKFGGVIFLGFMILILITTFGVYIEDRLSKIRSKEDTESNPKQEETEQEETPSFPQIVLMSAGITASVFLVYSLIVVFLGLQFGVQHGPFGDAFGALNAIAAFLGFTMISFSIFYQRKDFNSQIRHIEESNKQFKEHSNQLNRQSNLMEIDLRNNIASVMPYFKFSIHKITDDKAVPTYAEMGKMIELRMDNHGGVASGVQVLQPTYFVGNKRENICLYGEIDGIIPTKGQGNVVQVYSGSDTEPGSSFELDPDKSSELDTDDFLFVIICRDLYLKQHIFNFKLNFKTGKTVLCDLADKLFLCFHATPISQSPVKQSEIK